MYSPTVSKVNCLLSLLIVFRRKCIVFNVLVQKTVTNSPRTRSLFYINVYDIIIDLHPNQTLPLACLETWKT